MTDPEQGKPATPTGVAAVEPRRGHVLDVLAQLRQQGPAEHEPDRISTDGKRHLVELEFDSGPAAVIAWATALRLPRPANLDNRQLRQTIVQATADVFGWRVELRHVHTAPASLRPRS